MNRDIFTSWLDAYGEAWENQDAQAAAELFAEDAIYQETPFDPPMQSRAAIIAYWSDIPEAQEKIRFDYEILAVTELMGIARWRASFVRLPSKKQVRLDGILMVTLNGDNRCQVFREWWHRQEKEELSA